MVILYIHTQRVLLQVYTHSVCIHKMYDVIELHHSINYGNFICMYMVKSTCVKECNHTEMHRTVRYRESDIAHMVFMVEEDVLSAMGSVVCACLCSCRVG